ncbi:glycosyltransferase [Pseudoalteromonas sp. T1lg65]|uniref:glycosyltransferase n=1 Tax=Pseudoalteromonas sp. T1lg65 TaxID=2077101 RepID=UPI003F7AC7DB
MKQQFEYIAFVDTEKTPGVAKKIESTVASAKKLGLSAKSTLFSPNLSGAWGFIKALFNTKTEVVFVRFSSLLFPFLFFPLLVARLKGAKIVVDVPTPRKSVLVELKTAEPRLVVRIFKQLISLLSASWVLLPANLIVQYAQESAWYLFGVKHKTLKIGNGINIPNNLPIANAAWCSGDTLNLIAVAQLAQWHGYDRLLKAIAKLEQQPSAPQLQLTIVGEGEALEPLKSLAKALNIDNKVVFTGFLSGAKLDAQFSHAHIGVASLGLYRIGLEEASVLKTREYVARGLSVIGAAHDPDFPENSEIRLMVSNSDSVDDIAELLATLPERKLMSPVKLRAYAEQNLSMESKLKSILDKLN